MPPRDLMYRGPEGAKPVPEGQHFAYGCHLGPKNPKLRPLYNDKGEKVHGALFNGKPMSMAQAMHGLSKPRKLRTRIVVVGQPAGNRGRERRPACGRTRGSRRGASSRTSSRGGDSGDSESDGPGGAGPSEVAGGLALWQTPWGRLSPALYRLMLREAR